VQVIVQIYYKKWKKIKVIERKKEKRQRKAKKIERLRSKEIERNKSGKILTRRQQRKRFIKLKEKKDKRSKS